MNPCCPHCHRPLTEVREGVLMPTLKARIFDAVAATGDNGITARELINAVYTGDYRAPVTLATIRAHIWQINDLLEDTRVRIRCLERRWWVLVRSKRRGQTPLMAQQPSEGR